MNKSVLSLRNIKKSFGKGESRLDVLCGIDFDLQAGEMVALLGPSGSGKSTFLQIAGLLDKADSGDIVIAGQKVDMKNDDQRTGLRNHALGFVYQFHHLLPEFSALENVMLPQLIAGISSKQASEYAAHLLEQVGLAARVKHRPAELSGGEQQRVAIARALANKPAILITDEPTGNLDKGNSDKVFDVLQATCAQQNVAILMATHNLDLAGRLSRVIHMQDGIVL